jgi:hypothetical protein
MAGLEHPPDFDELEMRLKVLLPELYRDSYEQVQPISMGSTGLQYGADGKVAWDRIWGSFCDLAMAGGPPHRGTLLQPGRREEIGSEPERYRDAVDEICRGISMVTGLCAEPSPDPGWVRMYGTSAPMVGWLMRAIVMENVSARYQGLALSVPVGPGYRLEKEITNGVTAVAKTCHYWTEHMSETQHQDIAGLFRKMDAESPLIQPTDRDQKTDLDAYRHIYEASALAIQQTTGLYSSHHADFGWLGVECEDVPGAVRMMRLLITCNVASRREGTCVLLPVNPAVDPAGESLVHALQRVHAVVSITPGKVPASVV